MHFYPFFKLLWWKMFFTVNLSKKENVLYSPCEWVLGSEAFFALVAYLLCGLKS